YEQRTVRLSELELIIFYPGVQLTSAVLAELLDRGIETLFMRQDGSFRGRLQGHLASNPLQHQAQYKYLETLWGLTWAQRIVEGKINNQRVLLQRRHRASAGRIHELAESIDIIAAYLHSLKHLPHPDRETLMGIEGICARASTFPTPVTSRGVTQSPIIRVFCHRGWFFPG
ncbi:MAG: CRISPR-associated endonuclease Cas1, partial [Anaerolineales bacterium]